MDSKCWWNGNFEISSRNWEHEAIEEIDEKNGKSQNNIIFTVQFYCCSSLLICLLLSGQKK